MPGHLSPPVPSRSPSAQNHQGHSEVRILVYGPVTALLSRFIPGQARVVTRQTCGRGSGAELIYSTQALDAYSGNRDRKRASISSRAGSRDPRSQVAASGRMLRSTACFNRSGMYRMPGTAMREVQRGTIARPSSAATRLMIVCFSSAICAMLGLRPACSNSFMVRSWLCGRDRRSGTIKG